MLQTVASAILHCARNEALIAKTIRDKFKTQEDLERMKNKPLKLKNVEDCLSTIFVDATVNLATVFTDATFSLGDITAMEIGGMVIGATSGTTGVITAMDSSSVTVDNVDGFFKSGETVGANDVTNLTISSFG